MTLKEAIRVIRETIPIDKTIIIMIGIIEEIVTVMDTEIETEILIEGIINRYKLRIYSCLEFMKGNLYKII